MVVIGACWVGGVRGRWVDGSMADLAIYPFLGSNSKAYWKELQENPLIKPELFDFRGAN